MELHDNYPGVEFTPPEGTVAMGQEEGTAQVRWLKVGDRFVITEFDGVPLERGMQKDEKVISKGDEDEDVGAEIDRLSQY